jgi:hypothetical protein
MQMRIIDLCEWGATSAMEKEYMTFASDNFSHLCDSGRTRKQTNCVASGNLFFQRGLGLHQTTHYIGPLGVFVAVITGEVKACVL